MSNSPLVTYTNISKNKTSPRNHKIDTITIHCYVGQVTAKQGCDYFATTTSSSKPSSNYVIGKDGSIGLSVDEKDRANTTGGKDKNGLPIRVNGISGADNDHRAVTIEVASDNTEPYAITDKAYNSLIKLVADICKRNDIKELKWCADKSLVGQVDKQNMTVHRWFANKSCPGNYLYSRMGAIATAVNAILKDSDNKEDGKMSYEEFIICMNQYRNELRNNDANEYSEEARKWAVSNGLIKGSGVDVEGNPNNMWGDFLTREQFVTVLYRFAKLIGKA